MQSKQDLQNLQKNKCYEILITGTTQDGSGVGKIDGFAVFVPNTTIGDFALIKLIKINKSYGFGRLEKLITPSKNRIEVACKSFFQCGGCAYQHINYESELEIKADLVKNSFQRLGGFSGIEEIMSPIIASKHITHYRNKAQYPFGIGQNGDVICGFYARHSHRIIECDDCLLQPAFFSDITKKMVDFAFEYKIKLRHLYLRYGEKTDETMVCLVVSDFNIPQIDVLINRLTTQFPNIKSVILNKNDEDTNVILGNICKTVYGSDTINDILCGIKITLSPLSFYQVNRSQAENLYNKAIEYANLKSNDILLDLYCGAGTIGLAAADKVKELIGVEIIEDAIENAKINAKNNNIENARFICADANEAAKKLCDEGIKPDVIIVDPPRKGLEEPVIDAILQMAPSRIVMISCNPSTAARDCELLCNDGMYEINAVTPVDMFPRTTHVEAIILMTYCGDKPKK